MKEKTKEDNENNKRISRGGRMKEQKTRAKSNEIVEREDNTAC